MTDSHSKRRRSGGSSRIIAEAGGCCLLILAVYSASAGEVALAGGSVRQELPMRAIVNGHNMQPRNDRIEALGYSDVTSQQAEEINHLYAQLMRSSGRASQNPS
ncbi:MAG: hypothetical protein JOY71_17255 [Acetobacteraceae bacterium]|nr:hypothetical protein [Acetobacteraceae bacterium]